MNDELRKLIRRRIKIQVLMTVFMFVIMTLYNYILSILLVNVELNYATQQLDDNFGYFITRLAYTNPVEALALIGFFFATFLNLYAPVHVFLCNVFSEEKTK